MELYKAAAQQSSIEMNDEVLRLCQLFARPHLAMRNTVLQGVTSQYDAHDERNIAWAGLGCSLSHTRSHVRRANITSLPEAIFAVVPSLYWGVGACL